MELLVEINIYSQFHSYFDTLSSGKKMHWYDLTGLFAKKSICKKSKWQSSRLSVWQGEEATDYVSQQGMT